MSAESAGVDLAEATARFFEGRVATFRIAGFEDERGVLVPVEFGPLAFRPERAFLIKAPPGAVRGGHGHRRGRQLLLRISGEIAVELIWKGMERTVVLDASTDAIMIAAPVWSRQTYHGARPTLMVFCETAYDPDDYIFEPG